MRRFATTLPVLLVVLFVFTSSAASQLAGKVARIGVLCSPACASGSWTALLDELRKLGWVEGTTIIIERKEASSFDQLPALAADLVRSKPDLIVTIGPPPARAAKDATSEIPIVIIFVADPVGIGLASSLARPGGNLTGVATFAPDEFNGKMTGIIRELLPQATHLAAFINPANEVSRLLFAQLPLAAVKLGFKLDVIEVREAGETQGAFAAARDRGAEVLYIPLDPIFAFPDNRVPDLAAQAGLPSIYLTSNHVKAGGLLSYGPDFPAVARRGAHYIDRILKGTKPADLPIEQPTRYLLAINLKTAKALGMDIPVSLLARADTVFE